MAFTLLKYFCTAARHLALAIAVVATGAALTGCDDVIYDEEGDCEIHHRLRFRFDYNLLFADAFSSQVHSVAVYAFEPDGTFAWMLEESGWQLSAEGYTMSLDGIAPGEYTLVGWCGTDNSFLGAKTESFTLPRLVEGISTISDLTCRMNRDHHTDGTAHSAENLWPLFHGSTTDVIIYEPDGTEADGRTITYQMDLKKDTNRVRVVLQQLSGDDINAEGFTYTIETANGQMAYNNNLIPDETITYHPWNTETAYGGLIISDNDYASDNVTQVKVAIADLTIARMVKDHPTILTVFRPDGKVAARIPLVDYALLTKGNYSTPMTDQEFLDREDTYTLTFFLDKNYMWAGTTIYINSWRVVLNNTDI